MKHLTFFLFAASLTSVLNAQTLSGNLLAGGSLLYNSNSFEGNSDVGSSSLTFEPSVGYFVADNLSVGTNLIIATNSDDTGVSKIVTTSFGLGPFVRYYKFTSNENFAFFGEAQLYFITGKEDSTPGGENNTATISFSVAPGLAYFFTKHWALDLSITGLVVRSYDPNTDIGNDKLNSFEFGLSSFSPSLGLRYHFVK